MTRRKRQTSTFNLSFLDIMSCGFGAVVLVFLIIDHSLEVETQNLNAEVFSEINLLEDDIREGEAGLVRLRNALASADLEIVETEGLATRVTEERDRYEALIASLEESGLSETQDLDELKAEINRLEERLQKLRESADSRAGQSARSYTGDGNRQYLTGLNLGGRQIAILVDQSASMLADKLVNVIRLRNMDAAVQRQSEKWQRTLDTVDWLTAQLPVSAKFQLIGFNTEAKPVLAETADRWIDVADNQQLTAVTTALRDTLPSGGSSLHKAFSALSALPAGVDNIFLITDGLPTQGDSAPNRPTISGQDRLRLFRDAIRRLPASVPVNIILQPMEGDPMAASEFWQLAQITGGSFLTPARDWP